MKLQSSTTLLFLFCILGYQSRAQTAISNNSLHIDTLQFDSIVVYTASFYSPKNWTILQGKVGPIDSTSATTISQDNIKLLTTIITDSSNYKQCLSMKCFEEEYYYVFFKRSKIILSMWCATNSCGAIQTNPQINVLKKYCTRSVMFSNSGLEKFKQFYKSIKQ